LPLYAFQRERYWIEPTTQLGDAALGARAAGEGPAAKPVYLVDAEVDGAGRELAVRIGAELGAKIVFADEFGQGPATQLSEAVRREHGRLDGVLNLERTPVAAATTSTSQEES
jgi:hypothetical protein